MQHYRTIRIVVTPATMQLQSLCNHGEGDKAFLFIMNPGWYDVDIASNSWNLDQFIMLCFDELQYVFPFWDKCIIAGFNCTSHVFLRLDWCLDLAHILSGPHVRLRLVQSLYPRELCPVLVHYDALAPFDHLVHHFMHQSLPISVLEEVGQEKMTWVYTTEVWLVHRSCPHSCQTACRPEPCTLPQAP